MKDQLPNPKQQLHLLQIQKKHDDLLQEVWMQLCSGAALPTTGHTVRRFHVYYTPVLTSYENNKSIKMKGSPYACQPL